jgi:hypothetical protein
MAIVNYRKYICWCSEGNLVPSLLAKSALAVAAEAPEYVLVYLNFHQVKQLIQQAGQLL